MAFGCDKNAGNDGYASGGNTDDSVALIWRTRGSTGGSRADMVGMTHHYALRPLVPKSVLRKEIGMHRERARGIVQVKHRQIESITRV